MSLHGNCGCCYEEDGHLYLDGYIERRVRAGDKREYPEPGMGGLPEVHGPMQMESSFIVALREAKKP